MKILGKIKRKLDVKKQLNNKSKKYENRFDECAFKGNKCSNFEQYEAVITRWYHTIEKGLAYVNFRAGFGKNNMDSLLETMDNYIKDGYDENAFFFQTSLSVIQKYIRKNAEFGVKVPTIEDRIKRLPGVANNYGGIIKFEPLDEKELQSLNYKDFICNRHSMRHFSSEPVDMEKLKAALKLAQYTPSACNRQGWSAVVVNDKKILAEVLKNQNGNEGFGQEFDKLLLLVADLSFFNHDRELFQPYIDGGMYAQSVLNALHFYHIAAVPLSASLTEQQEKHVRRLLSLNEAEVLIMFIGIGNYPDICQTTRSERRTPKYRIV